MSTTVKTHIIKIGNSQGIRIPKLLLDQVGLGGEVEIEAQMNRHIATVILAPMTTQGRPYPTRVPCHFQGKDGHVVLDQLRTVDKVRLIRPLGQLDATEQRAILAALAERQRVRYTPLRD